MTTRAIRVIRVPGEKKQSVCIHVLVPQIHPFDFTCVCKIHSLKSTVGNSAIENVCIIIILLLIPLHNII